MTVPETTPYPGPFLPPWIPPAGDVNDLADASRTTQEIASPNAPLPDVYGRDRVKGKIAAIHVDDAGGFLYLGFTFCSASEAIDKLFVDGIAVDDATDGLAAAGGSYELFPLGGVSTLLSAAITGYTDNPTACYCVLRIPRAYSRSFPRVEAIIRGRRVYDPRTTLTAYSENPVLAAADVAVNAGWAVNWTTVTTGANFCDTQLGGVASRIIGLTLAEPRSPEDWMKVFRIYTGCFIYWENGELCFAPDTTVTLPTDVTLVLNADTILGDTIRVRRSSPLDAPTVCIVDHTNAISDVEWRTQRAVYTMPNVSARATRISLPGIKRYAQAYREAEERIRKLQNDLVVDMTVFDEGLRLQIGSVVSVTHPIGLNGYFRVLNFNVDEGLWRLTLSPYSALLYSTATPATPPGYVPELGAPDSPVGNTAIVGALTNSSVVCPSDSNGENYSLAAAGGTFKMWQGTTDVTTASAFSVLGGTDNGTTYSRTLNGLTLTINKTTGVYALTGTAWTSDSESFSLLGTYNAVTIPQTYSIAKAKGGTVTVSGSLVPDSAMVSAFAEGTVANYNTAYGTFRVYQGNTEVTTLATFAVVSNPQGLTPTASINAATGEFAITGGFDASEDTAQITYSASYAGVTIQRVFTLTKLKGGYEIVSALPSTNLFVGRMVFLTTTEKLYRYTATGWSAAVPTTDLTGGGTAIGGALNADPGMADPTAWFTQSSTVMPNFTAIADGKVGATVVRSPTGGADSWINGYKYVPIDHLKTYRVRFWARTISGDGQGLYVGVCVNDAYGDFIGGDGAQWLYAVYGTMVIPSTWTEYVGLFGAGTAKTFPANARTMTPLAIFNYSTYTGMHEVQDLRIEEVIPGTLIKDGAIITNHMAANTINGDRISAGTIVAGKLSVTELHTITANLGSITAGAFTIGSSPAVSGTTMTGAGTRLYSDGDFCLGNSTTNITFNGTVLTLNGNVVYTGNIQYSAVSDSYVFDMHAASTAYAGPTVASGAWADLVLNSTTVQQAMTTIDTNGRVVLWFNVSANRGGSSGEDIIVSCVRTSDSLTLDQYPRWRLTQDNLSYSAVFIDDSPSAASNTYKIRVYNATGSQIQLGDWWDVTLLSMVLKR